jgi:exopolysaccharide biosynthesis operon protein EpsL
MSGLKFRTPNAMARAVVARRRPTGAVCVVTAMFLCHVAVADEFDTVNVVVGDTLSHDSNVFRLPSSSGLPPGSTSRSDVFNTHFVGLRLNKPYALQRFQADVTKSAVRYNNFSTLDSDTLNYHAAWLWALTPRLTGTLSTDQTQGQASFAQFGGTQRNLTTTENTTFSVDGWITGGWHLLGSYTNTEHQTDQPLIASPSSRGHRSEVGVRYDALSGNSVTFTRRRIPSSTTDQPLDPINFIDTGATDTETELRASWRPTGKSTFDGRLTYREHRSNTFTQRDFSGVANQLSYSWAPTGKLTFILSAVRDIQPYVAFGNTIENASFRVDHTLFMVGSWQTSAKTAVRVRYARTQSDFGGPVFAVTGPPRSDDLRSASIAADWSPRRFVSLSAIISHERRMSNVGTFEFNDTTASVTAAINF